MIRILPFALIALILGGCSIYNDRFQCPIGEGLKCVAAGEVVDRIVEREEDEDLFFKNSTDAKISSEEQEARKKRSKKATTKKLKLEKDEEGNLVLSPESDENNYR